jgi:hypothetical protein
MRTSKYLYRGGFPRQREVKFMLRTGKQHLLCGCVVTIGDVCTEHGEGNWWASAEQSETRAAFWWSRQLGRVLREKTQRKPAPKRRCRHRVHPNAVRGWYT